MIKIPSTFYDLSSELNHEEKKKNFQNAHGL